MNYTSTCIWIQWEEHWKNIVYFSQRSDKDTSDMDLSEVTRLYEAAAAGGSFLNIAGAPDSESNTDPGMNPFLCGVSWLEAFSTK